MAQSQKQLEAELKKTINQQVPNLKSSKKEYQQVLNYFLNNADAFEDFKQKQSDKVDLPELLKQADNFAQNDGRETLRRRQHSKQEQQEESSNAASYSESKSVMKSELEDEDDVDGIDDREEEVKYDQAELFASFRQLIVSPEFVLRTFGKYYFQEVVPNLILLLPGDLFRQLAASQKEDNEDQDATSSIYNFAVRLKSVEYDGDVSELSIDSMDKIVCTIQQPCALQDKRVKLSEFVKSTILFGERMDADQRYDQSIFQMQFFGRPPTRAGDETFTKKAIRGYALEYAVEDIFKFGEVIQILQTQDHSEKLINLESFLFGVDVDPIRHGEAITQLKMRLSALRLLGQQDAMKRLGNVDEAAKEENFLMRIKEQIKKVSQLLEIRKQLYAQQLNYREKELTFVGSDSFYKCVQEAEQTINEFVLLNSNKNKPQLSNNQVVANASLNQLQEGEIVEFQEKTVNYQGKAFPRASLVHRCDVVGNQKYIGKAVYRQTLWVQGRALLKFQVTE